MPVTFLVIVIIVAQPPLSTFLLGHLYALGEF